MTIYSNRGSAHIVKKIGHQTGTTNKLVDFPLDAMPPGWRISKHGNIYFEGRKNRSDLFGKIWYFLHRVSDRIDVIYYTCKCTTFCASGYTGVGDRIFYTSLRKWAIIFIIFVVYRPKCNYMIPVIGVTQSYTRIYTHRSIVSNNSSGFHEFMYPHFSRWFIQTNTKLLVVFVK